LPTCDPGEAGHGGAGPAIGRFSFDLDASAELRDLLSIGRRSPAKGRGSGQDECEAGASQELRNLLAILINNDRIGDVREVVLAYRAEMQERQGIRSVEIVTARELSEKYRTG